MVPLFCCVQEDWAKWGNIRTGVTKIRQTGLSSTVLSDSAWVETLLFLLFQVGQERVTGVYNLEKRCVLQTVGSRHTVVRPAGCFWKNIGAFRRVAKTEWNPLCQILQNSRDWKIFRGDFRYSRGILGARNRVFWKVWKKLTLWTPCRHFFLRWYTRKSPKLKNCRHPWAYWSTFACTDL